MKKTLGALAAAMLALAVFAPPAEAHCWWNGYRWHCYHRHYVAHPYRYYGYHPYAYYRPYYRSYYYRPYYAYACVFPRCW